MAFADIKSVTGAPGDFKVTVVKKPRYVDPAKCNACTACFPVCPVGGIPMEFNFGRGQFKAIHFYSPFPPRKALIDPEKCSYILDGKCGDGDRPPCVEACKPEAIVFSQEPVEVEFNVGAIIVATGLDEAKEKRLEQYGYPGCANVLTALEYERLLSGLGPTGGVVRRDDKKEPASIAWYVLKNPSEVGFMTAAAQAMDTLEKNSSTSVSVFHGDVELARGDYAEFHSRAKEVGVEFISAESIDVTERDGGDLDIAYADGKIKVEMLILVPPYAARQSARELSEMLGLAPDGKEGVFVCGNAWEAKGIDDAVLGGYAAAANAAALLASERGKETVPPPERDIFEVKPGDEPKILAVICRCGPNIAGALDIDELVAYTASLPGVEHVELTPFGCDGVKVRELLKTKQFNRIVIGACSPKTHENLFFLHTEMGGLNRYLMEIVNLRNHCTWVHSGDKKAALEKAKTLMRMGVTRVASHEALTDIRVPVTPACLVIGGTPSGIACALRLGQGGMQVHLAVRENDFTGMRQHGNSLLEEMIDQLGETGKIRVGMGVTIGRIQGFVGNFRAELVSAGGMETVDVGSIVAATGADMKAQGAEGDYESDLLLQRDDKGFFVGMLGLLNPLDCNTDGVFRCGSARRAPMSPVDAIIDGEAAASRVAGVISRKELVKSPAISWPVDEYCDGCAYCVEPCPANAITLIEYMQVDGNIKKTVEVNEAVCRGCGMCMATCPKKGIFVKHFKPEYFEEMIKSIMRAS